METLLIVCLSSFHFTFANEYQYVEAEEPYQDYYDNYYDVYETDGPLPTYEDGLNRIERLISRLYSTTPDAPYRDGEELKVYVVEGTDLEDDEVDQSLGGEVRVEAPIKRKKRSLGRPKQKLDSGWPYKRELINDKQDVNMDFKNENLTEEYFDQILNESKKPIFINETSFNENVIESELEMRDVLAPLKNLEMKLEELMASCSEWDKRSLGVRGWICLWRDLRNGTSVDQLWSSRVSRLLLFWLTIFFILMVLPLWCCRGWFSCCCPSKYCSLDKMLRDHKKFLSENPPGILLKKDGTRVIYEPLSHEIDSYNRLTHKIDIV